MNFASFCLAGNGALEFTAASQDMIDSPTVPPQVKAIFQDFQAAIDKFKQCRINADVLCMRNVLVNNGLKAMEQGVKLSQGPLQKLFQKMLNLDLLAFAKSRELLRDAAQQATQISDLTFDSKAKLIQQYLYQFQ